MDNVKCISIVFVIALVLTAVIYVGLPKQTVYLDNDYSVVAASSAWFQEVQRVKNMATDKRFGPSGSLQSVMMQGGTYRDSFIPTGPPVPTYEVDVKNFGLADK